eukprot:5209892-Heterocapsa_arctica.AAC.1
MWLPRAGRAEETRGLRVVRANQALVERPEEAVRAREEGPNLRQLPPGSRRSRGPTARSRP